MKFTNLPILGAALPFGIVTALPTVAPIAPVNNNNNINSLGPLSNLHPIDGSPLPEYTRSDIEYLYGLSVDEAATALPAWDKDVYLFLRARMVAGMWAVANEELAAKHETEWKVLRREQEGRVGKVLPGGRLPMGEVNGEMKKGIVELLMSISVANTHLENTQDDERREAYFARRSDVARYTAEYAYVTGTPISETQLAAYGLGLPAWYIHWRPWASPSSLPPGSPFGIDPSGEIGFVAETTLGKEPYRGKIGSALEIVVMGDTPDTEEMTEMAIMEENEDSNAP